MKTAISIPDPLNESIEAFLGKAKMSRSEFFQRAAKLYLDKVTDNGMLTMHVSNRHLDLAPVAAAAALSVPGTSVTIVNSVPDGQSIDATPSVVVVITKRTEPMQAALAWQGAAPQKQATVTPWTDDYSDIISALWRVYGPAK